MRAVLRQAGRPAQKLLAPLIVLMLTLFGGTAAYAEDAAPNASAAESASNNTTVGSNGVPDASADKAGSKPATSKDEATDKPKTTDPPKDEPDPGDKLGKKENSSNGPPAAKKVALKIAEDVDPVIEQPLQVPTCGDPTAGFTVSLAANGTATRVALYNRESVLEDGPKTVQPGGSVSLTYEVALDEGVSLKVWVVDANGDKVKSLSPSLFGTPRTTEKCGEPEPDPSTNAWTPATCDNKVHKGKVTAGVTGAFKLLVNDEAVETKTITKGESYTFEYTVTPGVAYRFKVVDPAGAQVGEPTGYTLKCEPPAECTKVNDGAAGVAEHVGIAVSDDRTSATFSLKPGSEPFCTPITPGGDLLQRTGYVPNWQTTTGAAKFPQTLVRRDQSAGTTLVEPLTVNVGPLVCQGQVDFYVSIGGVNVGSGVTIDHHHGNTPGLKNLFGQLVGGDCPAPSSTVVVTDADCEGKYKVTIDGANIPDGYELPVVLSASDAKKIVLSQNDPKTYTNYELGLPDVPKDGTLKFEAVWGKGGSTVADLERPYDCEPKLVLTHGGLTYCEGGVLSGKKMVIYVYPTAHIPGEKVVVTNGTKYAVFMLVGAIGYDNPLGKPVGQYEYSGVADFIPAKVWAKTAEGAELWGKIVEGIDCTQPPPTTPPTTPPPPANPPQQPSVPVDNQLPVTGSSLVPAVKAGAGALLIGLVLLMLSRRRQHAA